MRSRELRPLIADFYASKELAEYRQARQGCHPLIIFAEGEPLELEPGWFLAFIETGFALVYQDLPAEPVRQLSQLQLRNALAKLCGDHTPEQLFGQILAFCKCQIHMPFAGVRQEQPQRYAMQQVLLSV